MIKANFNTYASYVTDSLYQWELNQVLSVTGLNLTVAPEVHFSNSNMDKAIVRQATLYNHVVSVNIPNSLLQDPLTINAHIGIYEGDTFKVIELVQIPIIARKRPADYQIQDTDEEIYSFKALVNALANKADNRTVTARIDNIIAHNNDTEGNTELLDLRVDTEGTTHNSAGTAVRAQFNNILTGNKFLRGLGTTKSLQGDFPYTDVNNFPVNSIITVAYPDNESWLANLPKSRFTGTIITLSQSKQLEGGNVQIAFDTSGNMYTRTAWSYPAIWSKWYATKLGPLPEMLTATTYHVKKGNTYGYTSFDDFPLNTTVVVDIELENRPEGNKSGLCITFKGINGGDGSLQLFASVSKEMSIRFRWSSKWTPWTKIVNENDLAIIENELNTIKANLASKIEYDCIASFLKIGCIGDSLASGESIYKKADGSNGYVDIYEHSWGQFLARRYGIECINFSTGGLTTRTWLTHSRGWSLAQKEENLCNAYIIGLGQNDIGKLGTSYLGTINDIDLNNYENNADTYYGNYGKIIQLIKTLQPKAKFFLLTDPVVTGFNNAIAEIANTIPNCYLIDLTAYSDLYKSGGYLHKNNRGGHYNSVAYNYMGKLIGEEISKYMYNNPDEFNQIEFIGTDYTY